MLLALAGSPVQAEDPAVIAERQEAEERQKRMTAEIEDLKSTIQSYGRRIEALREEVGRLSEELDKVKGGPKDVATQDQIKTLAKKIEEVDRKRIADNEKAAAEFEARNKVILDKLGELAKSITVRPQRTGGDSSPWKPAETGKQASSPNNAPAGTETGYEYTIREGDTLSGIISKLAKQNIKVTLKQMKAANPKINWDALRVGSKIFIPAPVQ